MKSALHRRCRGLGGERIDRAVLCLTLARQIENADPEGALDLVRDAARDLGPMFARLEHGRGRERSAR